MKILMYTTYYAPHISGLTLYFQQLAEEYAQEKHQVTMLCGRHDKKLPKREILNKVEVIRSNYLLKINKGLILPFLIFDGWNAVKEADVVHLNLPAPESLALSILARIMRKKVVSTYVCDVYLPQNVFGAKLIQLVIDIFHHCILLSSQQITSFTKDFATSSRVLKKYSTRVREIFPPVSLAADLVPLPAKQREQYQNNSPIIGMATRIASEKGIHIMLQTLANLKKDFPQIKLVIAGTIDAPGESLYKKQVFTLIKELEIEEQVIFLDTLQSSHMPSFYHSIGLLVVASTNSTEAFGIVQIEAMLAGVPVVATDLPGVRMPIRITGMGEIAKVNDISSLEQKIRQILKNSEHYLKSPEDMKKIFLVKEITNQYFNVYGHYDNN